MATVRSLLALASLVGALTPAPTQEAAAPPVEEGPRVVLESLDGALRTLRPAELATEDPREQGAWLVHFLGYGEVPAADEAAMGARVRLRGGDLLLGRVVGGAGEVLELRLAGGLLLELVVDELAEVRFPARIPEVWTDPIEPAAEGDRLYRRRFQGLDPLDGTVEEFTDEGVRFHGELGSKLVPWDEVGALFVADFGGLLGAQEDGDERVPVVCDLADGSRLRGGLVRLDGAVCVLATTSSGELELDARALRLVTVADGRVAFLSDRDPARAQGGAPFGDDLGLSWPHRRDRAVLGGPLRAGGRSWPRGLGVHAPSSLAWALDGGWTELRGSVAIDDSVLRLAERGSVVFRVRVDGETRWESPVVRGGETPLPLGPVDLTGARELALEVDPGPDSFVADRAAWLAPLLVRAAE